MENNKSFFFQIRTFAIKKITTLLKLLAEIELIVIASGNTVVSISYFRILLKTARKTQFVINN